LGFRPWVGDWLEIGLGGRRVRASLMGVVCSRGESIGIGARDPRAGLRWAEPKIRAADGPGSSGVGGRLGRVFTSWFTTIK
jgi:hypothetical protein